MKQLLANGLFVIKGTDTVGQTDSFLVAEYQSSPTEVCQEEVFLMIFLDTIVTQSSDVWRQHWGIGGFNDTTFDAPMILSFVTSGGSYKHYYTDGALFHELTSLDKNLAGFWTNGTSLYLITKDGNLYGSVFQQVSNSTNPL
ncbi:MAG: hypothetical protein ACOXZ7_06410 [Sphaerochaeta sp.]